MIKKEIVYTLLFLLISNLSWGQYSDEFERYKKIYPKEDRVRLNIQTTIRLKMVKGELEIEVDQLEEDIYLNENANFYSKDFVSYSSFFELYDLKASSFSLENGKYKEFKVKEFNEEDDLEGDVFYDDRKNIKFRYPSMKKGGITRLSYKEKIKDPRFLSSFFFGDFIPIVKSSFTIIADPEIKLKFKEFHTDGIDLDFKTETKKGVTTYSWSSKNTSKYENEPRSTNFRAIVPHVIPYIASIEKEGENEEILKDVKSLYNWYYSLIKDVNSGDSDQGMIDLVNELVKDKKSEYEKVKAIFYWTQQNIKYVAFEYALGGFIPRNANDVFNKKYGDCKDNTSIMHEMLKIAGIKSHFTWIGTRDLPYVYSEVPTPVVDNHMILTYYNNGEPIFLDATGRYMELGMPSSFIQGKEALVSISPSEYKIEKVPEVESKINFWYDTVKMKIDGKLLVGEGDLRMNGYPKTIYFNSIERFTSNEVLKKFYTSDLKKGNNKFIIRELEETNKFDYEKDYLVNYTFDIGSYIIQTEDEIYLNPNLNKNVLEFKIGDEDKIDKDFRYRNFTRLYYEFEIPEGYNVKYLPESTEFKSDYFEASIHIKMDENKITYIHEIHFDFIDLKAKDFKEFNSFISTLQKAYKESIVFNKQK